MSEITDALETYYSEQNALAPVVGIRQDLGLSPTILGYTNDNAGIGRQDAFSAQRIKARALGVEGEFGGAPGAYPWKANETVVSLGADAVRFRVLGDLALKAIRTDPAYRDVAREYFRQANEVLKAALDAIGDALAPQTTTPAPDVPTLGELHSQSVKVTKRW